MGILTAQDKEKIKRVIPKASNKIIDATVAQLYVAYPDHTQWKFTGIMGAVVLVDDLVGHTFFLKIVDITGARGVVWDQELYVDFAYHQDRTYFHTFEIEECLAGLLFEDTHDAAHFLKRVSARHKHASKQTVNNKNAVALKDRMAPLEQKVGMRGEYVDVATGQRSRRARGVLYYDDQPPPEWRLLYAELAAAGISEDMIAENRQFIKDYIAQQGGPLVGLEPPIPRRFGSGDVGNSISNGGKPGVGAPVVPPKKTKKAPPPPPPSQTQTQTQTPPPPPPYSVPAPPSVPSVPESESESEAESSPEPENDHSQAEESRPRFRLPPANAPIPPVSHSALSLAQPALQNSPLPVPSVPPAPPRVAPGQAPALPPQRTGVQRPGPPPPPRAARSVPPPPPRNTTAPSPLVPGGSGGFGTPGFGQNGSSVPPPPPPPRAAGNAPPPPPSRASRPVPPPNVHSPVPPPAIPQNLQGPPPPQRNYTGGAGLGTGSPTPPPPPPLPPVQAVVPPPPPLPPVATGTSVPSPPPLPPVATGGPPPPPPPPPPPGPEALSGGAPTAPLPMVDSSRGALLASIENSGIGMLKKTDKSQLEKPSVLLKEARGEPVSAGPSGGAGGQPETLADALASALNKRKGKVAESDDEDDNDDW